MVWSPAERLNLIASWTREEGAPSLQQLGDPLLVTPGTRVFDYRTGETVLVDGVSGGNPDLSADKRNVFKIGGTYRPLEKIDLDLRVDYVASRLTDPVTPFPGQTPALEAAFPDRFQRDSAGNLIRVDFRPVNFDRADRAQIRWGFNFTKPLRTARPSSSTIDRIRARAEATGGAVNAPPPQPGDTVTFVHGADGGPPPGVGPDSGSAGGRPGHGGGGRGGFGGGGRNGGRLQFSAYHTLLLMDEVRIRPGLPLLDHLDGEAADGGGGRSRHQIELEGGWANNGLGARLSHDWKSGTRVDGGPSGKLDFAPLGTFNLRLFANLGERLDLVARYPLLRGTQVRFGVENLFDSKQKVRDNARLTPVGYQPDLLDPQGRTLSFSIRKLFLPPLRAYRHPAAPGTAPQAPPNPHQ